jgi:ATP-dependent RNA helicase MRH4
MLSTASPRCIFCQFGVSQSRPSLLSSPGLPLLSQVQVRFAAQLTRRKPNKRYDLSTKVAVPSLSRDRKPRSRPREGPFAGMNRTKFNPDNLPTPTRDRVRPLTNSKDKKGGKKPARAEGSFHALKMQQSLVDIGYGRRMATKDRISEVESFEDFGLLPAVQEAIVINALNGLEEVKPTPIQKLAIPAILGEDLRRRRKSREEVKPKLAEKRQFLLAAETGSGKTLAYMIPAIDAIKRQEKVDDELEALELEKAKEKSGESLELFDLQELEAEEALRKTGRPRVVVLVPTAELVDQVGRVAKSLSHHVKFRAAMISSAYSSTIIRNRLFNEKGIDFLVATPSLLSKIITSNPAVMSRVTHLIIDEADSLLDRSFEDDTGTIIERALPSLTHLIMCSATIPKRMDDYLRKNYPDVVRLTTPNLHAIPRRVQLGVVDVAKGNFFDNKNLACADTIWNIGKRFNSLVDEEETDESGMKRIIVFVNEREKTVEVADYLQAKGIDAMAFSRDMEVRQQSDLIAEFTGTSSGEQEMSSVWKKSKISRKLDNTRVLVTTDLASRGIDTTPVRDVILYDVPQSTVDFIHRLGRTGRMGRRGRAVVLVGKNDRRDVVSEVKHSMFRGQALI